MDSEFGVGHMYHGKKFGVILLTAAQCRFPVLLYTLCMLFVFFLFMSCRSLLWLFQDGRERCVCTYACLTGK